ncbi:hypothetical protein GGS26DRAFT_601496 [Hypomontagnella submonticulosa]|nr:hypothetical protein GGS26DRAFT_601496 [Hypomontagnella submonticulosa]
MADISLVTSSDPVPRRSANEPRHTSNMPTQLPISSDTNPSQIGVSLDLSAHPGPVACNSSPEALAELRDEIDQRRKARKALRDARKKLIDELGPRKAYKKRLNNTLPSVQSKWSIAQDCLLANSIPDPRLSLKPIQQLSPSTREMERVALKRKKTGGWQLFPSVDQGFPKRRLAMLNHGRQIFKGMALSKMERKRIVRGESSLDTVMRCTREISQHLLAQGRYQEHDQFHRGETELTKRAHLRKVAVLHRDMCDDLARCFNHGKHLTIDIKDRWKKSFDKHKALMKRRYGDTQFKPYSYRPGPLRQSTSIADLPHILPSDVSGNLADSLVSPGEEESIRGDLI